MTIKDFGDQRVWRKSSRSADQGGSCLYVTVDDTGQVTTDEDGLVGIRDSKLGPEGEPMWMAAATFASLVKHVS